MQSACSQSALQEVTWGPGQVRGAAICQPVVQVQRQGGTRTTLPFRVKGPELTLVSRVLVTPQNPLRVKDKGKSSSTLGVHRTAGDPENKAFPETRQQRLNGSHPGTPAGVPH